ALGVVHQLQSFHGSMETIMWVLGTALVICIISIQLQGFFLYLQSVYEKMVFPFSGFLISVIAYSDSWDVIVEVPYEYVVRLALWTPNDTVYCNGIMYCLTFPMPYNIISFCFVNAVWSE
ncbi:hypothetical protein KI387_028967, partial [Taxus chinensis]